MQHRPLGRTGVSVSNLCLGTMEHLESQLAAADVELTADVLDRIDEIVPPGVTINPADNGWVSPSLQPSARRR
jgi:aryl-alcohol dehydrogenase-like predicted oxidoreductase